MKTFLRTCGIALGFDLLMLAATIYALVSLVPDIRSQHWTGVAMDVAVPAFVIWRLPYRWRTFRSADHDARAEMVRAARQVRKGQVWLNRDKHVIFSGRHMMGTQLRRFNEDDFMGIEAAGHGAAVSVTYLAAASEWGVLRMVEGTQFTEGPGGVPVLKKDKRGELAKWLDAVKLARWAGSPAMHADAAEIRKVLAEMDGAELLSGPEAW